MKRMTKLSITAGLLAPIMMAPILTAQENPKPDPVPPYIDALGPQLIAWSEVQKPQPVSPAAREQNRNKQAEGPPDQLVPPAPQAKANDAERHAAGQK